MSIDGKITARHIGWFIIIVRSTVVITTILSLEAGAAQDAWISELIAFPIELIMAVIIVGLALRFPTQSLFDYPKMIFGKIVGTVIILGYLWYFFFISVTLLRELSNFITTVFLQTTPPIVVMTVFLAVVAYTVYLGIEPLARFTDLFLPLLLFMTITSWIFIWPDLDFTRLMPVLVEQGLPTVVKGGIVASSGFMFCAAIGVLFPLINTQKRVMGIVALSLLTATVFISFTTAITIAALGAKQAEMVSFKGLSISQIITIGQFAERLDPIALIVWVGSTFIKVSVFFYCFISGLRQSIQSEKAQVFIIPSAIMVAVFSLLVFTDFPQLQDFLSSGLVIHNYIFILVIPTLMLVTALIFNKKGETNAGKN